MLQLNPPLPVLTAKGRGYAYVVQDYSQDHDTPRAGLPELEGHRRVLHWRRRVAQADKLREADR